MRFARVGSMALWAANGASATLKDFRVALVELTEGSQILLWRSPRGCSAPISCGASLVMPVSIGS